MSIVSGIPEKCKRCYACVRECPAKAIKVEKGQAQVIAERCIACGNCVKVCAQNAKRVEDGTGEVTALLARKNRRAIACLAPSFPAAFDPVAPGRVVAGLRRLGFKEVWSVAFGAELISREYGRLFESRRRSGDPVISTPCPAVVAYVEKYMPELRRFLAPIVSPMIATARAIRFRYHDKPVSIVFIGPCIAKKNEIRDPAVDHNVDAVLTYKELVAMFDREHIRLDELKPAPMDGPPSIIGWSFPLSSGLLKTVGISRDILDNDVLVTEGKDRALAVLHELADGVSHARFLDVLFCEGCISGPTMLNDLGVYARKEIVADYVREQARRVGPLEFAQGLREFEEIDLCREFSLEDLVLPQPDEEAILRALESMKKYTPEDHLNCGACGYPTCREKAIAVCQGLAEASMCLPYLVEELETMYLELQESHHELAAAQQRLVQSERLASMGQLSAGVAHEINNPLGTVLLYSHVLLRQIKENDPMRSDVEMIASEATRCKNIVRGLLDFARQSRVSKTATDLAELIRELLGIMGPRAEAAKVALRSEIADDIPMMMIDGGQIKQMLINLIRNGIEAIDHDHGEVCIKARRNGNDMVEITVSDNGSGIAPENLPRMFTPFFTTKEMGKGTGLGLAIAYGIVKMHYGDISLASTPGVGTTFTILLPVGKPEPAAPETDAPETAAKEG